MILPLESQVCSLESAKRLKELGFSQESLFYWVKNNQLDDRFFEVMYIAPWNDKSQDFVHISAYTGAELGELLPWMYEENVRLYRSNDQEWRIAIISGKVISSNEGFNTEDEARAKMLIYLAENGLIGKEKA